LVRNIVLWFLKFYVKRPGLSCDRVCTSTEVLNTVLVTDQHAR